MNPHPIPMFAGVIELVFVWIWLVLGVVSIVGMWKVFVKAGQPGWGSIVPFYNRYCLIKIAGKPDWWLVWCFVPLVNIVMFILIKLGIARNFGKCGGFAAGLIFLPFIFYPILGFGDDTYNPAAPAA